MVTRTITEAEALAFTQKHEDHFFDFKSAQVAGAKVQRALVAFANTDGGELLIGILDEKEDADPAALAALVRELLKA